MFILGLLTGLLISLVILVSILFLRTPINKTYTQVTQVVDKYRPKEKGALFEPLTDIEEQRQDILNKNNLAGKDTPLSDLYCDPINY